MTFQTILFRTHGTAKCLRISEIILEIRVRIVKEEENAWEDARLGMKLFCVANLIEAIKKCYSGYHWRIADRLQED